jgi:hypothetical protein
VVVVLPVQLEASAQAVSSRTRRESDMATGEVKQPRFWRRQR